MKLIDFDGLFDEKLAQYMEENKEKYMEEENIRAQQILSGEDEILDEEMEIEEEDELSEEELDKKLRELNL